jgi:hypothetical protein
MAEYLISFHDVEPEIAEAEIRVITLPERTLGVPAGVYGVVESYCPDPTCDCRRVMLNILGGRLPGRILATISYAFDPDDEMPGPFLDPINPQSEYAAAILPMIAELLLADPAYVARLGRHYAMVKQAAADPEHPAYAALRAATTGEGIGAPPGVDRNAPCPCGSGRKFKHCHGRRDQGR